MDRILIVTNSGNVVGVWSDDIPWQDLGHITCRRLSRVEWDPQRQEWVATDLATGRVIATGPNRAQVLQAEADHYSRLLADLSPEV